MSKVRSDVDLSQLKRSADVRALPPPRRWLRIVIPVAILAAFAAILFASLGDFLGKAVEVTVIRPKPATGDAAAVTAGAVALQAAGWVEPDPYPIFVPALASGVLREIAVQESDRVKKGDVVARLVDDDARIGLEKADAALAEARAEKERAAAVARLAKEAFDAALSVTENAAAMKASVEGRAAECRHRAAAVAGGESDLQLAREELAVQEELARRDAAGHRAVEIASARVRAAASMLEKLKAESATAVSAHQEAEARARRASKDLELRIDDRLSLEKAQTEATGAEAKLKSAEAARKEAALRLDRMTIRSPIDGVVLERLAAPGSTLVTDNPERAAVCSLYDPAHLRVRVDVSQSDVGKVSVDQDAEVLSQSRSQRPYKGKVIRIVQRADNIKVTLQVHVRLLEVDNLVRPEMVCQAKFLAPRGAESAPAAGGTTAVLVPSRLLTEDRFIWTVDPEGRRAKRRGIEVAGKSGEWALVRGGLNLSDKLIDGGREQLSEDAKIRIKEE